MLNQLRSMLAILNDKSITERQRIRQSHDILWQLTLPLLPPEHREPITTLLDKLRSFLPSLDTAVVSEQVANEQVSHCSDLRKFAEEQLNRQKVQLIQRLDQAPGKLPIEAMLEIRQHRDLMIPALIECLELAADQNVESDDLGLSTLIALYMLAEFKASEALPTFMRILAAPDEHVYDFLGDALTEDTSTILAQLIPDSAEVLEPLILNTAASRYVRWEAMEVYLHQMRDGHLSREATLEKLTKYLRHALESRDEDLATGVIYCLRVLAPREVLEEIKSAFDKDLVDESFIRYKNVEEATHWNPSQIEEALGNRLHQPITDAIKELSSWACFREDRPRRSPPQMITIPSPHLHSNTRPGRNDPCPCGSGKKYKKCCALKVSR